MEMANEISNVADRVKWFKQLDLSEIGRMAEMRTISDKDSLEEVMDRPRARTTV